MGKDLIDRVGIEEMIFRKIIVIICATILLLGIITFGILSIRVIQSANGDATLRWTMIGAMGSWAGSLFGAIALIISLFALWLPQKVKLKVEIGTGMMMSQVPAIDKIDAYIITVKNVGMRAVTVNNIYLNFGGRKMGDIFVGVLNQGSPLQIYTPQFPKRLEQGESFDYFLLRDKLVAALKHYEEKTPKDTPLFVRVDEVTTGSKYHKMKWTLNTFIK